MPQKAANKDTSDKTANQATPSDETLRERALQYHAQPQPGKISIQVTKPTCTQSDLSLAYTPGVAEPVKAIHAHPHTANQYTRKGNLIGVITDGTAVLGLGNVGPLASKPVMEGKAVLFKQFADIDVFDIEVQATSPDDFINTVASIAPTFGGINLEDIKSPECFYIEEQLKKRLNIPVFHDDQHGTAITVAAGLLNALTLQDKTLDRVTIVCLGAGAAGTATIKLLHALGADPNRTLMVDRKGVIHTDRREDCPYKRSLAVNTTARSLEDAMNGADVFIGVAGPNALPAAFLNNMAKKPIVFALSNPDPEIGHAAALATRQDLIMATGRSDFPNQINNVLCFPYIFRGALDAQSPQISQNMQLAAVHAIRQIAFEQTPQVVVDAYADISSLKFGPDYILPKPLDPRLRERVSEAVKKAALKEVG